MTTFLPGATARTLGTYREPMLVALRDPATDRSALDWAADRAVSLNAPLTLLHAIADPALMPPGTSYEDEVTAGRALAGHEAERLVHRCPRLRIGTYLHCGDVVEALLGLSAAAPMIVVGADRKDPVSGEFSGSVAVQVALNSSTPVVVVPPRQASSPIAGEDKGGVVVGVDGSDVAQGALMSAAGEADLLVAPLTVVTALGSSPGRMMVGASSMLMDVRGRYPRMSVNWIVDDLRGPAQALARYGVGSDLLVIGRHGSGARSGMVLGSVTRSLLLEPPCPTLVVTRREPGQPADMPAQGQDRTPCR